MRSFIQFLIQNNEKIIYISGGVICLLSAVVVWWQVFGRRGLNTRGASDLDIEAIEESLKKILEQTNVAINNVPTQAASATLDGAVPDGIVGTDGQPIKDIASIKTELEARAKIIEELQIQVAAASSDTSSEELLAKIRDLEGKLAEYEIIEDDIADLSHFKEENAKLKKELEGIQRAGPAALDEFADALAAEAVTAEPVADEVTPAVEAEEAPIAEVAAAQPDPVVAEEIDPIATAVEAAQVKTPIEPVQEEASGDIFAEFTGEEEGNASDPLAALGDIDPDRMLDELKDLNANMEIGAEALDEAPDIEKMADEAKELPKKG